MKAICYNGRYVQGVVKTTFDMPDGTQGYHIGFPDDTGHFPFLPVNAFNIRSVDVSGKAIHECLED